MARIYVIDDISLAKIVEYESDAIPRVGELITTVKHVFQVQQINHIVGNEAWYDIMRHAQISVKMVKEI